MWNQSKYLLRIIIFSSDMLLLNMVLVLESPISGVLYHQSFNSLNLLNILACNFCWLLATNYFQLYKLTTLSFIEKIFRQSYRSFAVFAVVYFAFLALRYDTHTALRLLPVYSALLFVSILVSRFLLTYLVDFVIEKANLYQKIAIVGYNDTAKKLAAYFVKQNKLYSFEGFFNTHPTGMMVEEDGTIVKPLHMCMEYAVKHNIREIYSTLLPEEHHEINHLLAVAEQNCVRVKFVPAFFPDEVSATNLQEMQLNFLNKIRSIGLQSEPLYSYENRFKKRFFDILFSLFVIVFFVSWMFPIIALLIKLQSKGPILFKQLRTGKNNEPFWCYKFRSMYVNTDSDLKQSSRNDSRITPLGRVLRKTSLDEFPQFFNVLLGNMSIVGPRPHMLKQTEQYSAIINRYMVRQFLKPGISGWAQVNGYRGETREPMLMQKRVEHDIWYMENWSLMMDVRIVFMTVINIFKGESTAY
jgi:putative colanic acid biosynthesis UDP-glucose lipid carrier transferase